MEPLGQLHERKRREDVFGVLEVVDAELVEVAGDYPARADGVWQVVGVPFCLLKGRFRTRFLLAYRRLVKRDAATFHFYEHAHVLVEHVDLATFDLAFEF